LSGLDTALQLLDDLILHAVPLQQIGGLPRVSEGSFILLHVLALDVLGQLPMVGSQLVILILQGFHGPLHVLVIFLQLRELCCLLRDNLILLLEFFYITLGFLLLTLTRLQTIEIRLALNPTQRVNLHLRCIPIPQQSFVCLEFLFLLFIRALPDGLVDIGQTQFGGDFNSGISLPNPISPPQRQCNPVIRALPRVHLCFSEVHRRRHPTLA
jgi:hypothetical protein